MFQRLLISTVLISQVLWLIRPVLPYAEYVLNYEYISEVLCINQDQPQLECDGKCYLKRQIQQQSDPEPAKGIIPLAPQWDLFATTFTPAIVTPTSSPTSDEAFSRPVDQLACSQWLVLPSTPPPRKS